ncbi:hypothetical protein HFN63_34395 [Rhizobium leguminosarum]|uniref:hypothetical protein n=1 Tax=Rhizobium leguminosarum TaxID=384 RepID=UPI001C954BCF|nr:hypothetical protein [Rhizobium leguminosarum]MBY5775079.1 hypothetical protein [Rhizobium leguminosarum]
MPLRRLSHRRDMENAERNPKRLRVDEPVLNDMPVELVTAVTSGLVRPDVHATVDDLSNVKLTSDFNRRVLVNDPKLKRIDSGFREAIARASDLSASLVRDVANVDDSQDIAAHGKMLSALAPVRRRELVKGALGMKLPIDQAIAIAGLWEGADHLPSLERSRLAKQSLVFASLPNGDPAKEIAIAGLWLGGVKHLSADERTKLVTATLSLDPDKTAQVISGSHWLWGHKPARTGQVGESLPYLSSEDISDLVRSLHEMSIESRAMAIGAISAGFGHLKPGEVKDLVEMIWKPEHPHALGKDAVWAIRNMTPGLKFLDEAQINELAEVVSNPDHPHHSTEAFLNADAMATLAPRHKHFNPDDLCDLLSNPKRQDYLREAEDVALTLASWGDKLTVFRPEQRSNFVRIITDPDHPRALTDESDICFAISGMARGLVHLQQKERSSLVQATLGLTVPQWKAEAIAGLGQGLEHLKKTERSTLVEAIEALEGLHKAIAIAGLAKGLAFLQPQERKKLIDISKQLPEVLIEHGNQDLSMRSLATSRLMAGVNSWQAEVRINKNVVVKELESVMDRDLVERSRERGFSAER